LRDGITFKTATAHGYGRAKKKPNNRDSIIFTEELQARGIKLFDTALRKHLYEKATLATVFSDVGGALSVHRMPNNGAVDSPETYIKFPPGGLVHFLTHPGNYNISRQLTLGVRYNTS